jgi:hypothetical protein
MVPILNRPNPWFPTGYSEWFLGLRYTLLCVSLECVAVTYVPECFFCWGIMYYVFSCCLYMVPAYIV